MDGDTVLAVGFWMVGVAMGIVFTYVWLKGTEEKSD